MRQLHGYQEDAAVWLLSRRRGYLCLDPGLGKTVVALAAAQMSDDGRFVQVVCPASVVSHWQRHAAVWAPSVNVNVVSWDKARRGDLWPADQTSKLILDEAHYAKSLDSKRTRVVLKHAQRCAVVWPLSATPVPNGSAAELYPTLKALFPEVLKAAGADYWDAYANKFCHRTPVKNKPWKTRVFGTRNAEILRPLLAPHFYRRRVTDVYADLPPLRLDVVTIDGTNVDITSTFDPETADLGEQASARRALGLAKVGPVVDILRDELSRNEIDKVVVFAHHLDVIERLRSELSPFGVCGFTGAASARERQKQIDAFNVEPSLRVFVGQQEAAGTGTNLQAAREVVLLEPSWVPGDNSQAIRRVYRPASGVQDSVRARIFAVAGTQDERLMSSLVRKTRNIEDLGIREVA